MTFIDLVLQNGELIRVECPDKVSDEVYQAIENAMKRRDWWAVRNYTGVSAEYLGLTLDRVNMGQVVATL